MLVPSKEEQDAKLYVDVSVAKDLVNRWTDMVRIYSGASYKSRYCFNLNPPKNLKKNGKCRVDLPSISRVLKVVSRDAAVDIFL